MFTLLGVTVECTPKSSSSNSDLPIDIIEYTQEEIDRCVQVAVRTFASYIDQDRVLGSMMG